MKPTHAPSGAKPGFMNNYMPFQMKLHSPSFDQIHTYSDLIRIFFVILNPNYGPKHTHPKKKRKRKHPPKKNPPNPLFSPLPPSQAKILLIRGVHGLDQDKAYPTPATFRNTGPYPAQARHKP